MIFVTLGSQKFQFNRLLQKIDDLIFDEVIQEPVFAQIGCSDYEPMKYNFQRFLDRNEFNLKMKESDIVITHGGTGAIISAVKAGKKVIGIPRLAKYEEHVDDHQIQLLHRFDDMGIIEACYDVGELIEKISIVKNTQYNTYHSNTSAIIKSIDEFINK